jgi:hypothetical protein
MRKKTTILFMMFLIILPGLYSQNLGDIIWEGTIPNNPCTSFNDLQPKSLKEIPDVNGDGKADIVVATENYWTICLAVMSGRAVIYGASTAVSVLTIQFG